MDLDFYSSGDKYVPVLFYVRVEFRRHIILHISLAYIAKFSTIVTFQ